MFSRFLLESTQVNSMKQNVELQQTLDSSNMHSSVYNSMKLDVCVVLLIMNVLVNN